MGPLSNLLSDIDHKIITKYSIGQINNSLYYDHIVNKKLIIGEIDPLRMTKSSM